MTWIVGAAATTAASPFYPPTALLGSIGWVLFVPAMVGFFVVGYLGLTVRLRMSWNRVYFGAFQGVALAALLQWVAGGGHAPYIQLLILPLFGVCSAQTVRRCIPVLALAWAAAFSPVLYSGVAIASTVFELVLLSFGVLMLASVMTTVRAHRAQLRDAGESAAVLARHDAGTGLPNRRSFEEELADGIARAAEHGTPVSLLMFDLDAFKPINDHFGHSAGDACLLAVADALRAGLRRPDAAFRWAGDEFAVILHDTDEVSARVPAARLQALVRERCARPDGRPMTLGAGIAQWRSGMSAEDLVEAADAALLADKAARVGHDAALGDRAA